jgi:hypothetical protein
MPKTTVEPGLPVASVSSIFMIFILSLIYLGAKWQFLSAYV